jgi:uncharacterized membrane protein
MLIWRMDCSVRVCFGWSYLAFEVWLSGVLLEFVVFLDSNCAILVLLVVAAGCCGAVLEFGSRGRLLL